MNVLIGMMFGLSCLGVLISAILTFCTAVDGYMEEAFFSLLGFVFFLPNALALGYAAHKFGLFN